MHRTAKKPVKKIAGKKIEAAMDWQTGDFERDATFHFILPYQFLLLCRLMDVTPEQLLTDFMDNLSCGSWKRSGKDEARKKLVEYFLEQGYGQHHYTPDNIHSVFREMNAMGMLWPEHAEMRLIDIHSNWIREYHQYWFHKWFQLPARRKL
jgi:hypothetical protein